LEQWQGCKHSLIGVFMRYIHIQSLTFVQWSVRLPYLVRSKNNNLKPNQQVKKKKVISDQQWYKPHMEGSVTLLILETRMGFLSENMNLLDTLFPTIFFSSLTCSPHVVWTHSIHQIINAINSISLIPN
jgi:hypothetical protein